MIDQKMVHFFLCIGFKLSAKEPLQADEAFMDFAGYAGLLVSNGPGITSSTTTQDA